MNERQCMPTGREKQNGMEGGSEKAETSSEAVMKQMHNRVILLLNWLPPCILSSFASEIIQ